MYEMLAKSAISTLAQKKADDNELHQDSEFSE